MTASKSNGAYDTLISLRDKLTRLNGVITPEAVNKLEDELGGIFTVAKTHHYVQGQNCQKYGLLASAIPKSKYRLIIGDATWTHGVPADPGAYSQAALNVGNAAAQREKLVAEHKILQESYNNYLGVKEAGKELILYAVGDDALAPLKQLYIGFGNTTVLGMINHLRLKRAIKMTTAQKHEYRMTGYNNPWDPTTSITAYFAQLDRFQVSLLGDHGIATSEEEKTMAAGAQMWNSEMFTEDQMVAWENKTAAQQTWAALQTYFTDKWLERKQYSATTAKQSRFKEAALLAQETAAAEEEGESQVMLSVMLQEQHDKQIAAMTATNKANMDAMMERMNAMITGIRGGNRRTPTQQTDKENTPPGGNISPPKDTDQTKKPRNKKPSVPTAKHLSSTNSKIITSSRQTKTSAGQAGSPSMPPPDKHRGHEQ
jgi:hypothetical protein